MINEIKKDIKAYRLNNGKIADKPSLLLVLLFRLGNSINKIKIFPLRFVFSFFHRPIYVFYEILTGINIPVGTKIGGGLRVYHFGTIIINKKSIIGENCKIRPCVVIGNKNDNGSSPIIGDNCNIGAGAKILGEIVIGNNVTIGANAVVVKDVPDNCIAIGIPAINNKKK
jgi:serine O-acetyltransferase